MHRPLLLRPGITSVVPCNRPVGAPPAVSSIHVCLQVHVLDVQRQPDGTLLHTTDAALEAGQQVDASVDWARRFDFMQQHTGDRCWSPDASSA